MLVYFCPHCLSITTHMGSLLAECSSFYDGCPNWAVAIAHEDGRQLRGSHLQMIPDRRNDDADLHV